MLAAVRELQANQTWAQEVAAAGRHLAAEILHPDNVARSDHLIITGSVPAAQHMQALLTVPQSTSLEWQTPWQQHPMQGDSNNMKYVCLEEASARSPLLILRPSPYQVTMM